MRRATIHIIVVALVGWLISGYVFGRAALRGETSHDFGTVDIADSSATVKHVFHLDNRSGKRIDIKSIKPDCGCTVAQASQTAIEPGATVDIDVQFQISKHGQKKSTVTLDLGDAGLETLRIQATGRMLPRLFSPMQTVELVPDMRNGEVAPVTVPVFANVFGSTESPNWKVVAPTGIEVRFGGWNLKHQPKDPSAAATEWEGQLTVSRGSGDVPAGATLQFLCDNAAAPLIIPVVMAQSLTGTSTSSPSSASRTGSLPAATAADR